ncbi:hypothetical protein KIN20_006336 [Parelaphostrongylus tenuis]|uniref:Uncharacterized protein n=1 Tax=Parelaphostrongylus tenuis TaxID=148309 RepID=A0AAD5QKW1_PARTN|nr:hypothetical protein KIN20_006336 [Parelaphostrongylus tenuis]
MDVLLAPSRVTQRSAGRQMVHVIRTRRFQQEAQLRPSLPAQIEAMLIQQELRNGRSTFRPPQLRTLCGP